VGGAARFFHATRDGFVRRVVAEDHSATLMPATEEFP
jgi:hypothetical protein